MTKNTLLILSILLSWAIILWWRTILFSPSSTVTTSPKSSSWVASSSSFVTKSHTSAPEEGTYYVPFDPKYGLQGTQRSPGRRERIKRIKK